MRLVLFTRSLDLGGAERQLVTLAIELKRRQHDVEVLTMYGGGVLTNDLEQAGVPVCSLEKRGRWHLLGVVAQLVRYLRQRRPHALLSYLVAPNILAALCRPCLSRTRIVWGLRTSDMDFRFYEGLDDFTFQISRKLAGVADRIIVNSHAGVEYHAVHGFPREKMEYVPNGIDLDRFRFSAACRDRLRNEWGVDEGTRLVGIVARLDPVKDHATFLQSAILLIRSRPDVRFVVIGDGAPAIASELRNSRAARQLGDRVLWAGARGDMSAVYSALDVGTLCSRFGEGFPNSVAEGLACELPMVVTDVGDAVVIVNNDERVVAIGDAAGLASQWQQVLARTDVDRAAADSGLRSSIEDRFSVSALGDRTETILREICR